MQCNFNQPGPVSRVQEAWHGRPARESRARCACHKTHYKCLTFLAANGRRFLAPENDALVFLYQIRARRSGIALAMMQVDGNYLASDTKPLARFLTLCATSAFFAPPR
jgi:hypothetical protein